jgi:hypothetical protein
VVAEELGSNVIDLEGDTLMVIPLGFTDSAGTTCLHVPSLELIAAGDSAYNGVHLHLSESPDQQKRQEWIAAVDTMASPKMTKLVTEAGIPLVYVNLQPAEETLPKGVAYVGSEEIVAGKLQGEAMPNSSTTRAMSSS